MVRPTFESDQWWTAFANHFMFQMLLGPLWSIIMLIRFGYVHVQNYGFVPGTFNVGFVVHHFLFGCIVTTAYCLVKDEIDYRLE